jgi:hypothetical protein
VKATATTKTASKAPKTAKTVAKRVPKGGAKKAQKGGNSAEEDQEPGKRYFKCIMINVEGVAVCTGRYCGKKPKQAASKACTRLYESYEDDELPEQIVFGMHECTRTNKKKKKYFYTGKRMLLDEPEEVEINKIDNKTGKKMVIKYYYNNDVRKLTDKENCVEFPILANYDAKEDDQPMEGGKKTGKNTKKGAKKVAKKGASKKGAPKKGAPKKKSK